jgi:hypothetical protein
MRRSSLASLLLLVFCHSAAAGAATLDVVGGQLLGASGVLVDDKLYDVEFIDGSCIALFSGCDSSSDFAFANEAGGLAAATALASQVFLDGPEGNFDTLPGLTFGCGDATTCEAYIPYVTNGTTVLAARMRNKAPPGPDVIGANLLLTVSTINMSSDSATYAVFTAVPVPEPSAASFFALGLGLVGLATKRRRSN